MYFGYVWIEIIMAGDSNVHVLANLYLFSFLTYLEVLCANVENQKSKSYTITVMRRLTSETIKYYLSDDTKRPPVNWIPYRKLFTVAATGWSYANSTAKSK